MPETRPPTADQADPARILGYHAHIYYEPGATEELASALREAVGALFPSVQLGRWHAKPIGPHSQAMFQIAFPVKDFPRLVPWLMLNRQGLDVLLHPDTGDDLPDHRDHAAWLGRSLPLDLSALEPDDEGSAP